MSSFFNSTILILHIQFYYSFNVFPIFKQQETKICAEEELLICHLSKKTSFTQVICSEFFFLNLYTSMQIKKLINTAFCFQLVKFTGFIAERRNLKFAEVKNKAIYKPYSNYFDRSHSVSSHKHHAFL